MVLYLVLCLCAWQTVNTLNEILLSLLHNIDSKLTLKSLLRTGTVTGLTVAPVTFASCILWLGWRISNLQTFLHQVCRRSTVVFLWFLC